MTRSEAVQAIRVTHHRYAQYCETAGVFERVGRP